MPNFANRLKQIRTERKVTQKELAEYLNVSQNAIFNWENEKREPPLETISKIADFFSVTPAYIMGWEDLEQKEYYLSEDARNMAQFLFENPEYKVLFDASRKVKPEDIEFVKQMIDRLSPDQQI